ncbi:MAG: hypothetical protein ACI9WU_005546, partial [Myxococcota bacterium]
MVLEGGDPRHAGGMTLTSAISQANVVALPMAPMRGSFDLFVSLQSVTVGTTFWMGM